jgi:23S rRNA (cytosine1962-C5)-methyltransferase
LVTARRVREGDLIESAVRRRAPLWSAPQTNAFRLINRAGDGFPALAVDRFGEVLVAHQYDSPEPGPDPANVLRALAERAEAGSVYLKRRPAQANVLSSAERARLAPAQPLIGRPVEELVVRERGLRFSIHPGAGLSVGLFLDMRLTREWVQAHSRGGTVLNCFAYTCGFGVAAAAGGAARVVNIDNVRRNLDWGRRNYALNGLPAERQDFIDGDVFDWLRRFARRDQKFDLVILDPPSYSTTRRTRFSVMRDYVGLTSLAATVVAPGGWLLACANSVELSGRAFHKQLRAGLEARSARIAHTTHEPELDFPRARGAAPYLKVSAIQLTPDASAG